MDALCGVPGGEALLEEHGDFVWLNTAPGTPYVEAWERGRRHVVESFPLTLQQRKAQKSTASALEAERGALENVLYHSCRPLTDEEKRKAREDQAEREKLDDIRWGRCELTAEAQRDLKAWWCIARDLASKAVNYHADGCSHLLQIRRHGLDAFETVVAPAFHEYIKAAAKFLVDQVQTTIREAEAAELEKGVGEGQPTAGGGEGGGQVAIAGTAEEAPAADDPAGEGPPGQRQRGKKSVLSSEVADREDIHGKAADTQGSRLDAECRLALQHYGKAEEALGALSAAQKFYLVCVYWKDSKGLTPAKIREEFVTTFPRTNYSLPNKKSGTERVKTGVKRGAALVEKLTPS